MIINGYSIDVYYYIVRYWCLLIGIILIVIGEYFIGGYWCLLMLLYQ